MDGIVTLRVLHETTLGFNCGSVRLEFNRADWSAKCPNCGTLVFIEPSYIEKLGTSEETMRVVIDMRRPDKRKVG